MNNLFKPLATIERERVGELRYYVKEDKNKNMYGWEVWKRGEGRVSDSRMAAYDTKEVADEECKWYNDHGGDSLGDDDYPATNLSFDPM